MVYNEKKNWWKNGGFVIIFDKWIYYNMYRCVSFEMKLNCVYKCWLIIGVCLKNSFFCEYYVGSVNKNSIKGVN